MSMSDEHPLSFVVEWLDPQAQSVKVYLLHYYADGTLEMVDKRSGRTFLKRIRIPNVNPEHLYIGASLTIYSRQISIIEAANAYTQARIQERSSKAFFWILPKGYMKIGEIIGIIERCQLQLLRVSMVKLQKSDWKSLPEIIRQELDASPELQQHTSYDVSVLVEVHQPTPNAFEEVTSELRSRALEDFVLAAADCDFDVATTQKSLGPTALFDNCTLCMLRPRLVREGQIGAVLNSILNAGFEISAMNMIHLQMQDADEFYAVYKGLIRQHHEMLKYMCSGPILALEVRGEAIVSRFRDFCGPFDVEVAKVLQPKSLRAQYGTSTLCNAIHCTDCPEDGVLECQFIFSLAI